MNEFKHVVKWLLTRKLFWAGAVAFALLYAMFSNSPRETVPISAVASTRKLPIYSVDSEKKLVALTFDAAWGNEDTQKILDILKENNVKVTFFMTGGWVEKFPEDVKMIAKDGHALGNHSENHKKMSELSKEECKEEILAVHNRVKELTGVEMEVFRPPYGDYDDKLVDVCYELKYFPIQWSVDSLDWKNYGVKSIIDTVVNHKALDNGGIILMHNGSKYTADALQSVIDGLKKKGYTFVTVPELIMRENYVIDHTGKQISK